ncbi:MAG: hypothetical protein A3F31_02700 [Candidatus Levybacteria bacterium RIFCSPHIGHO2_12_FULL_38_12]|nr:MAG: hypothetical protein A2770_03265 [Candidatus Levybacteria bacterium RIFCSPHIGHO2_01_FULL_38_12]OGH22688.1 MAG: hypothetical protein A3F31_02700 [Candidatus Levybacteria bacterium RIFCSPHIGHO2_12_FULL_38_12]OGH34460.1 MAG: hypothetical protein A3A47_00720 [Candidatus Levybacteria bacterium RIFCSPLOWO2_01_FULL_37_20]OGH44708.1 MAG: hypothetical protein A3J14_00080 [Candidatus Levybacteria bacterium RIFCSPLOWO2_02_FULL_37_18]
MVITDREQARGRHGRGEGIEPVDHDAFALGGVVFDASDIENNDGGSAGIYDNTFALYLRDINGTPLLTPEQEQVLFQELAFGRTALMVKKLYNPGATVTKVTFLRKNGKPEKKERDILVSHVSEKDATAFLARIGLSDLVMLTIEEESADVQKDRQTHRAERATLKTVTGVCLLAGKSLPEGEKRGMLEGMVDAAIRRGIEVKNHIIAANLRLVIPIAKRYESNHSPLKDAVQDGNGGLMRSVEKFDYQRGYKFSTYATYWILQAIIRGIANNAKTIRHPINFLEMVSKINSAQRKLAKSGQSPTAKQIAKVAGCTEKQVRDALYTLQITTVVSYNRPVSYEDDSEIIGGIADNGADTPSAADRELLKDELAALFETLSPNESAVLALRFGLGNEHPHSLEEIGKKIGLTGERARQIERKALRKLRRARETDQLREEYRRE